MVKDVQRHTGGEAADENVEQPFKSQGAENIDMKVCRLTRVWGVQEDTWQVAMNFKPGRDQNSMFPAICKDLQLGMIGRETQTLLALKSQSANFGGSIILGRTRLIPGRKREL